MNKVIENKESQEVKENVKNRIEKLLIKRGNSEKKAKEVLDFWFDKIYPHHDTINEIYYHISVM